MFAYQKLYIKRERRKKIEKNIKFEHYNYNATCFRLYVWTSKSRT